MNEKATSVDVAGMMSHPAPVTTEIAQKKANAYWWDPTDV
jgi:hypothetical protein